MSKRIYLSAVFALLWYGSTAMADTRVIENCGTFENPFGPWDYRDPDTIKTRLHFVEAAHFTPQVESLTRGQSGIEPGQDIDYILRVFPNHHRALHAMARHGLASKEYPPTGSRYSVECWFDRAKRFQPDDGIVWLISGIYQTKKKDYERAASEYEMAIELMPENPEGYYNLGLLKYDLGVFGEARAYAEKAYDLGHPLPGLRNKLKASGHWPDD